MNNMKDWVCYVGNTLIYLWYSQKSINVYKENCSFFLMNLYIICIKNICHNFYETCLYELFCLLFVYSVMLINTLCCLFHLMCHVYM